MASASTAEDSTPKGLNVKVLSQLPEPHGILQFSSLAPTTTVAELKIKIRDELPSGPPSEQQRLIHRGRVAARESATLNEIFGKDAVQKEDVHVIHLVIRDTRHNPLPQPDPTRTHSPSSINGWPPHQPITAPFADPANPPFMAFGQPQPNGQAPISATGSRSGTPNPFNQTPFGGINPGQLAQQQMAQMNQIHSAQHAAATQRQMQPGFQNRSSTPSGTNGSNQPAAAPQHLNPFAQRQSSHPRSSERNGTPQPQGHNGFNMPGFPPTSTPTSGNPFQIPGQQIPGSGGFVPQGIAGNFTREAVGPNGQRVTMTVNSSTGPGMLPGFPPMAQPFPPFTPPQLNNPLPPSMFGVPMAGFGPVQIPTPGHSQRQPHSIPGFPNRPALGTTNHFHGTAHAIESMRHYENDLRMLHGRLTNIRAESNASRSTQASSFQIQFQNILRARDRGQQMINHFINHGSSPEAARPTADEVRTLTDLNSSFRRLSAETQEEINRLRRSPQPRQGPITGASQQNQDPNAAATSQAAADTTSAASTNLIQPVTAYLLYSPTGPHAVVLSPQGPFSSFQPTSTHSPSHGTGGAQVQRSASTSPAIAAVNQEIDTQVGRATTAVSNINREITNANDAINQAHAAVNNLHELNRNNRNGNQQGPQNQQQQQPNTNQPNGQNRDPRGQQAQAEEDAHDILRLLIYPMFRHLWLLIRLFGFIWFLTRGGGSRRTFMIIGATMIYLAVQMGLLGDRWDRIRRHLEGLLGPPPEDAQAQQRRQEQQPQQAGAHPQQQRGNNGQAGQSSAPESSQSQQQNQRASAMPTPQNTAERLLNQRRERDRGWLRERLITVERALALFVASLYPGVGERHVAARERAVRAAQEEETRLARERERQQQTQEEGGQQDGPAEVNQQQTQNATQAPREDVKGKGKARASAEEDADDGSGASAVGTSTGVQAAEAPGSGSEMRARGQASSAAQA